MRVVTGIVVAALVTLVACGEDDTSGTPEPRDDAASVWIVRTGEEAVERRSLAGAERVNVALCCEPRALAVGAESAWVTTDTERVIRIDTQTARVVAEVDVGGSAGALAVGDGSVWVSSDLTDVVQISTETNEVVGRTVVGSDAAPIVDIEVGDGATWVLLDFQLALVQIDAATGEAVDRLELCDADECRVGAAATASGVGGGSVWVVDSTANELLAIDTTDLAVRDRARVDAGTWYVAAGSEGVFLLDTTSGRLERVDTDELDSRDVAPDTFARGGALTVGAGSVWLYDGGEREVVRLDPDGISVLDRFSLEDVRLLAVG